MKYFAVYMHINNVNGKKYIGITCQKPEQRWRKGKGYKNGHFKNAIDKYGWDNFEHIILYENLTKEEASKKEYELIKKYDTTNPSKGYNSCDGGGVTVGYHHTKESKEKMSKTKIGMYKGDKNPMYGKKGILAPTYGKHLTEEHKRKISLAKKGKITNYGKTLMKKIDQYDINGNFIKTWESISSIEKELGIIGTHISRVCKGKRKTTGGYIFKYHK